MPRFKALHAGTRGQGVQIGRFLLSSGIETTQTFAGLGLANMFDTSYLWTLVADYTNVSATAYPRVVRWSASQVVIRHAAGGDSTGAAVIIQIVGRQTNAPE